MAEKPWLREQRADGYIVSMTEREWRIPVFSLLAFIQSRVLSNGIVTPIVNVDLAISISLNLILINSVRHAHRLTYSGILDPVRLTID